MVTPNLIGLGLGLGALAGSLVLLWTGLGTYRFGNALAAAPPLQEGARPGTLTVAEGVIEGPQQGESLDSDWSGTPCVAYATTRMKQEAIEKHAADSHWTTGRKQFEREHEAIPFVLDTEVGAVQVEAHDAHVEMDRDDYERVSVDEVRENRGLLVGLWWMVRKLWTRANENVRREYLEASVATGDRVHVLGEYSEDVPAIEAPGSGPLVVTSRPPEHVVNRFKSKAKGRLTWGAILLAIAALAFLALTGVIG